MAKVKVIMTGSLSILGVKDENVVTGMQMNGTTVTSDVCANYFKAKNVGELVDLEVGINSDIMTRDLTQREQLDFNAVKAEFKVAKEIAEDKVVNMVFDELRGKK